MAKTSQEKNGNELPLVAFIAPKFGEFVNRLEHDPGKCEAVFPRDKRGTRLRGDHAQTRIQSAMAIQPNPIVL
jgi:hypothetical protein